MKHNRETITLRVSPLDVEVAALTSLLTATRLLSNMAEHGEENPEVDRHKAAVVVLDATMGLLRSLLDLDPETRPERADPRAVALMLHSVADSLIFTDSAPKPVFVTSEEDALLASMPDLNLN